MNNLERIIFAHNIINVIKFIAITVITYIVIHFIVKFW